MPATRQPTSLCWICSSAARGWAHCAWLALPRPLDLPDSGGRPWFCALIGPDGPGGLVGRLGGLLIQRSRGRVPRAVPFSQGVDSRGVGIRLFALGAIPCAAGEAQAGGPQLVRGARASAPWACSKPASAVSPSRRAWPQGSPLPSQRAAPPTRSIAGFSELRCRHAASAVEGGLEDAQRASLLDSCRLLQRRCSHEHANLPPCLSSLPGRISLAARAKGEKPELGARIAQVSMAMYTTFVPGASRREPAASTHRNRRSGQGGQLGHERAAHGPRQAILHRVRTSRGSLELLHDSTATLQQPSSTLALPPPSILPAWCSRWTVRRVRWRPATAAPTQIPRTATPPAAARGSGFNRHCYADETCIPYSPGMLGSWSPSRNGRPPHSCFECGAVGPQPPPQRRASVAGRRWARKARSPYAVRLGRVTTQ